MDKLTGWLKSKFILILLFVSGLLNLYFFLPKVLPSKNDQLTATSVAEVKDGDTLVTGEGETIRLINIDAPEYPDGCLATQAKDRLTQLVNGKQIELETIDKDNFGRSLAWVWQDKVLINKILVQEGLAQISNHEYQYTAELVKAQTEAKKLEKGIWSAQCQPESECVIKGNYRSTDGTRIYHLPECYNYDKIVIDQNHGDEWFCTEDQALEAGFRKSQDCPAN